MFFFSLCCLQAWNNSDVVIIARSPPPTTLCLYELNVTSNLRRWTPNIIPHSKWFWPMWPVFWIELWSYLINFFQEHSSRKCDVETIPLAGKYNLWLPVVRYRQYVYFWKKMLLKCAEGNPILHYFHFSTAYYTLCSWKLMRVWTH